MLIHYYNFELPIHPPETPVAWTKWGIRDAVYSGQPTFIRRTALEYDGPGNLKAALRLADTIIKQATEAIDVRPVNYNWGLYEGKPQLTPADRDYDSSSHSLVPRGYSLVAEVDTIFPIIHPKIEDQVSLGHRIDRYYDTASGYVLRDMCLSQVVRQITEVTIQDWYVDIEPRLQLRASVA
jgi:hypothetical protein